jgi:hypothetical protein
MRPQATGVCACHLSRFYRVRSRLTHTVCVCVRVCVCVCSCVCVCVCVCVHRVRAGLTHLTYRTCGTRTPCMTPTTPAGYFLYKDDRNTAATAATADAAQHIGKHKKCASTSIYYASTSVYASTTLHPQMSVSFMLPYAAVCCHVLTYADLC